MTPDDLDKVLHSLDQSIKTAVEKHVNGHIKELRHELRDHVTLARAKWESDNVFQEEIRPLLDALRFVNTFQRFLKWGGLTFFAFMATLYWLIRRS